MLRTHTLPMLNGKETYTFLSSLSRSGEQRREQRRCIRSGGVMVRPLRWHGPSAIRHGKLNAMVLAASHVSIVTVATSPTVWTLATTVATSISPRPPSSRGSPALSQSTMRTEQNLERHRRPRGATAPLFLEAGIPLIV